MKIMKIFIAAILMVVGFNASAQNIITSTEAHITINAQTTREQLSQLRNDLHAQGIDFQYKPSFDGQRHLLGLEYQITANEGAVTGTGHHKTLQNPNSSLTIHVNKTTGTFSQDVVGELTH
jgi:hypothetical protein